VIRTNQLEF